MNTSMTINATAAWLLGLYIANAEDHGVDPRVSQAPPERHREGVPVPGTYIFPPLPSRRLTVDSIALTPCATFPSGTRSMCAATTCRRPGPPPPGGRLRPGTAIGVLRRRAELGSDPVPSFRPWSAASRSSSTPAVRFVEETCKMRAFTALWDGCAPSGTESRIRSSGRFRYGVQVNSLGLTEAQPRTTSRIVLESLAVTLSKNARARPSIPGVERGPRPPPALGPAVVAPHPADPRLRVGSARVRRHLRRLGVIEAKTGRDLRGIVAELQDVLSLAEPSSHR